jgi:chromosome segregation ATPase
MTTQATVVSAVDVLKAQIAALKAQAKEVAKAERTAAKTATKTATAAQRAVVKELNKLHSEALRMNAKLDEATAKTAAVAAEAEKSKQIGEAYAALVARLAAVDLTVADFKKALPALSAQPAVAEAV